MGENNINIHLTSNTIPTSPEQISNSIGNFITKLPKRCNFSDEWEVALTEISYTKSWYNILEDQNVRLVDLDLNVIEIDEQIPAGNYETVEELLEKINDILERFDYTSLRIKYPPHLTYNKQANKVVIQLGEKEFGTNVYLYPNFDEFLASFLGLTDSQNRQYPNVDNYEQITRKERIENSNNIQQNTTLNTNTKNTSTNQNPVINLIPVTTPVETPIIQTPVTTTQSAVTTSSNATNNPVQVTTQSTSTTTTTTSLNSPILTTTTSSNIPPKQTNSTAQSARQQQKTKPKYQKNIPDTGIRVRTADNFGLTDELVRYKRNIRYEDRVYVEGFAEVTLYGSIKSLYVYCNIIKPVIVGDREVPLIRRVEIPSEKSFGQTVELIYTRPHYYPLVYHEFESIEIDIKDDTDKTVQFAFGRVALTLNFRKKIENGFQSLYKLLY